MCPKIFHRRDPAQHVRKQHIQHGADDQRSENANRHVASGILRFLGGSRDSVEADVCEEDDACGAQDAHDPPVMMHDALRRRVGRCRRNQRRMVRGIDESPPDADHEQHDAQLQDDDEPIDKRRFPGAAYQQPGKQQQDEHRWQVHDAVRAGGGRLEWRMRPCIWNAPAKPVKDPIGVLTPRDGDRCGAQRIFEDQIPADYPRDELAHRRVRVRVGAACHRDHRGEFGVAETRKRTANTGNHEGEHDRRTRAIGDRSRGPHEKTRSDNGADAQRDEVHRPEGALQTMDAGFLRLTHQHVEGLCCE